jgi:uncharacterized protein (TIGR00730 family)
MRPYEIGDPDIDARIRSLVADAAPDGVHPELIEEMVVTALKLGRDDAGRGDLKIVNTSLKEMRYSYLVFGPHRDMRKVTIFGSARTPPDDPNYLLAADFARVMTDDRGWMVITGAGPGIMEAGNLGAGRDLSFGVNIRLPFEAEANPHVHESRLINYKYFFTRKLMFVKESHAFALFPGGFGTQDETFETLTLMQTGKSDIHPIVLMEAPGTGYWESWRSFVEGTLVEQGMIAPDDLGLLRHAASIEEAAEEITRFYRNYHSQRFVKGRLVLRLQHAPTDDDIARINDEFGDLVVDGRFERIEATQVEIADGDVPSLPRIRFHFTRRNIGRLRALIDTLNGMAPESPPT